MISKICGNCGTRFEARRSSAKWCGNACKSQNARNKVATRKAKAKAWKETKVDRASCQHCGKGYWQPVTGRKAKFCSNSCRQMANVAKKTAMDNLMTRLQHMDYHMQPFFEARKIGADYFDELVARIGFEYHIFTRSYYPSRNNRSFVETSEMFPDAN